MYLPKGFRDIGGKEFLDAGHVRAAFKKRGYEIGCIDLATSPVGYAEFFKCENNAFGDRVFMFNDKSGRALVLTPDSYFAVMGWYIRSGLFLPERVCFTSDIFRYRHQKYRHFTQVGFVIVNEPCEVDSLVLVARAALKAIIDDLGLAVGLRVTDLSLWEKILHDEGHEPEKIKLVMKDLRYAESDDDRQNILKQCVKDRTRYDLARKLLDYTLDDESCVTGLKNSVSFAQKVVKGMDCKFTISPANFHSSEFKNGLSFQIVTAQNEVCGEGGIMTAHARKINKNIKSYVSFCSGIEFFIRRGYADTEPDLSNHVLLVCEPELESVAMAQASGLNALGMASIVLTHGEEYEKTFKTYIKRSGWILRVVSSAETGVIFKAENLINGARLETSDAHTLFAHMKNYTKEKSICI